MDSKLAPTNGICRSLPTVFKLLQGCGTRSIWGNSCVRFTSLYASPAASDSRIPVSEMRAINNLFSSLIFKQSF